MMILLLNSICCKCLRLDTPAFHSPEAMLAVVAVPAASAPCASLLLGALRGIAARDTGTHVASI